MEQYITRQLLGGLIKWFLYMLIVGDENRNIVNRNSSSNINNSNKQEQQRP